MNEPREPTADECTHNDRVDEGIAIWYPQMGGYVAKAVAVKDNGCTNLYVWHNGEFPFGGSITSTECWCYCDECPCCKDRTALHPKPPVRIHHCDTSQFIQFGETLERLLS